jgi:hypothetical protein
VHWQDMECSTSASMLNSSSSGPQEQIKLGLAHDKDSFDSNSVSFRFEFQKQGTTPASSAAVPGQRFTMVILNINNNFFMKIFTSALYLYGILTCT